MLIDFNRIEASAEPVNIAINAVLDAGARVTSESTRGYLGASAVGHPCLRKVQYDWMCDPVHERRTRDIFARGHFFEEQSRQHFRNAGFRFADSDRLEFEALDGWLNGESSTAPIPTPVPAEPPACPSEATAADNWPEMSVFLKRMPPESKTDLVS